MAIELRRVYNYSLVLIRIVAKKKQARHKCLTCFFWLRGLDIGYRLLRSIMLEASVCA